jgi:3-hydroxyisobutyrate dehydrogenase-like beta-hydroxyacid dehydrogenase
MSVPVAIIGLGLMGEVYAQRLIDAKIPVTGFDVDPARRARLAEIGGQPAPSVGELAKAARCVIVAVFSTDQVEDVVEQHLLSALGEGSGKIVLCMSTCDPDRVAALAARISPRGIRYLDVPVSGTSDQVRRGDGVALIGGDVAIADEVKDVLDVLFARRFHVGKVGDGGRAKLAVNLILGLNRLALAEGLVFAERDRSRSRCVSRGGAGFGLIFASHGHERPQDGGRRLFGGRPRQADTERCTAYARPGRGFRTETVHARSACRRPGGLRACRRSRSRQ